MLLEFLEVSVVRSHCGMHQHKFWEICLNLSGEGVNYFEQEQTPFSEGSIYVCPPFCAHKKVAYKGHFQDISILVSDVKTLTTLKNRYYTDNYIKCIRSLAMTLYDVYQNRPKGHSAAINSLTESICNMLVVFDGSTESSPSVEFLKNEINNNFSDPEFNLREAMLKTNYNEDYMRRIFKKEVGVSPTSYVNKLRIEKAQKILRQDRIPRFSIGEIAAMSGFHDACYFSRVFKKMIGTAPTKIEQ